MRAAASSRLSQKLAYLSPGNMVPSAEYEVAAEMINVASLAPVNVMAPSLYTALPSEEATVIDTL